MKLLRAAKMGRGGRRHCGVDFLNYFFCGVDFLNYFLFSVLFSLKFVGNQHLISKQNIHIFWQKVKKKDTFRRCKQFHLHFGTAGDGG